MPFDYKKALFTIIITKRVDKICYEARHDGDKYYNGYLSAADSKIRFIIKSAKISNKVNLCRDVLARAVELDLVSVTHEGFVLNFMEGLSCGLEVGRVAHLDCIGYYYQSLYQGGEIAFCAKCDKPFKRTATNNQYCAEHRGVREAKEVPLIKSSTCKKCGKRFFVDARAARANICPECFTF